MNSNNDDEEVRETRIMNSDNKRGDIMRRRMTPDVARQVKNAGRIASAVRQGISDNKDRSSVT